MSYCVVVHPKLHTIFPSFQIIFGRLFNPIYEPADIVCEKTRQQKSDNNCSAASIFTSLCVKNYIRTCFYAVVTGNIRILRSYVITRTRKKDAVSEKLRKPGAGGGKILVLRENFGCK